MSIDCRSEEGVTEGLIDSIISICRVLSRRRFGPSNVRSALDDLRSDPDVLRVMGQPLPPCRTPESITLVWDEN